MTYEVAKRWVEWGHDVHLVCGNYPHGKRHEKIDGVQISRLGGKYSLYLMAASYYLTKLKKKYDVVIDEINTVPFFTPLFVREPKVAFIHQLAEEILFMELPRVAGAFWYLMEPRVLRLYKNVPIMTVSKSTKEDLVKLGISADNIHVVTLGLDHDISKPGQHKSSYPLILYLGRIKQHKGIHYLVRAMGRVVKDVPNANLSIAGRGDPCYEMELERLVKTVGIENRVVFHGFVSEEEKVRLMRQSHVLVVPSTREGFGLVVLEAAACGTLSIGFDVPGLRDSIINHKTGILVPYGDIEALANVITMVLQDETLLKRLSDNAVKRAKTFNWDTAAHQMLQVVAQCPISNRLIG